MQVAGAAPRPPRTAPECLNPSSIQSNHNRPLWITFRRGNDGNQARVGCPSVHRVLSTCWLAPSVGENQWDEKSRQVSRPRHGCGQAELVCRLLLEKKKNWRRTTNAEGRWSRLLRCS